MRAKELTGHRWISKITISNPNYTGRIEVSVYAHNQSEARQLLKAQYGIEDYHIGAIRRARWELKSLLQKISMRVGSAYVWVRTWTIVQKNVAYPCPSSWAYSIDWIVLADIFENWNPTHSLMYLTAITTYILAWCDQRLIPINCCWTQCITTKTIMGVILC